MVGAVAVVLAVAEVVLHVVGGQVGEREAVVRGDEVEARERAALEREGVRRARRAAWRTGRCRFPAVPVCRSRRMSPSQKSRMRSR